MSPLCGSHLKPLRVAGEVRAPPPDAIDVGSVLVNGQLASEVRPVLVAEAINPGNNTRRSVTKQWSKIY